MGDASNRGPSSTAGMENLSLQTSRFPRDLLQSFMGGGPDFRRVKEEGDDDAGGIELNLGLSLGGRFGVDKSANSKLFRSSSIAGPIPIFREIEGLAPTAAATPYRGGGLSRTSSLPVETEEEWRKRKEMQSLRRMVAKRRRSEKQRISKGDGGGGGGGGVLDERKEIEVNLRGRIMDRDQYVAAMNRVGSSVGPPFGLPASWAAAAARQAILGGGGGGVQGFGQPSSQGSVESRGGSSSSISELESKPFQGSSSCGEVSPASIQSIQDRSNRDSVGSSGTRTRENSNRSFETVSPSRKPDVAGNRGKEIGTNSLEDMPCVFTKGDGPNGRRIEGILYKFGKGEEVRIMCVCHGNFLSPAEFVQHAGGTDTGHPLKHIVVNPNASPFS